MWNRFCTMLQAECTDGKTDKSELLCSYWDPIAQECVMVTQALLSVDYYRKVYNRIDELENMKQEMF
jgi:hypothetical protein